MRYLSTLILALLLLAAPAAAEDPGAPWVFVLQPSSGKILSRARVDRVLKVQVKADPSVLPHPQALAFLEKAHYRDQWPRAGKAPTTFHGRPVSAQGLQRTPHGNLLAFLELKDQPRKEDWLTPGILAVLRPDGSVASRLPGQFEMAAVDRSFSWKPTFAADRGLAIVGTSSGFEAWDLDAGRRLWASSLRTHARNLKGVWRTNDAVYVQIEGGLARLDPATGRTIWKRQDMLDDVIQVEQRADGNLYVAGWYPAVEDSLQVAVRKRFGQERETWVVPHGVLYFGVSRKYDTDTKRETFSVWELVDGRWQWIFDYDGKLSAAEKDRLFAKHHFSSWMRQRMETSN